ncbi:nicotinate-nucleotide diphosphorylase (carboxylating) [candidate division TA06 bacterium B3_TA06]|uniref:Probable nicotinate-nucleotide pyrophosphorylase [carboxylating] n=1 Tax=candidate division TA06 bacterium B3_TA06 TaxID=2012487 RepID=A0A532VAE1_UNCT6|nr:MAG: nicotinate-nucleotide diphosphorylase (carboxylating) [candidate division TA06 bacterium B3_TA06]
MNSRYSYEDAVKDSVRRALAEDIGIGDVTTLATVPAGAQAEAIILCKEEGVLAGAQVAKEAFRQVEDRVEVTFLFNNGERINVGDELAKLSGPGRGILVAERTALNFLQHLSGIATLTFRFVAAVDGTRAKILDTRKTTPGLRALEKAAVRCGWGYNHRMGLYDMILIKDNHIAACGSLAAAVKAAQNSHGDLKIEVECATLDQVKEALEIDGIDRIMLDNMSLDMMREAVQLVKGKVELEASGGVSLETVRDIALTGVAYISVGALTHSAKALDISLEITAIKP